MSMDKYGTFVKFKKVGEETEISVALGDTELIEELEKSAEWEKIDENSEDKEN